MKILRDSLAEDDASSERSRDQLTARERLRREAMALQKVRHPGVCGIVDMELDDALAFIVTELIEGRIYVKMCVPTAGMWAMIWNGWDAS